MKFTIKDRILLPQIFPKEGKFETLIIIEDIKKKIEITQKDIVDCNITSKDGMTTWDEKDKKPLEIEFSEIELKTISDLFKKTSDEGKLSLDFLPLYKLFVK